MPNEVLRVLLSGPFLGKHASTVVTVVAIYKRLYWTHGARVADCITAHPSRGITTKLALFCTVHSKNDFGQVLAKSSIRPITLASPTQDSPLILPVGFQAHGYTPLLLSNLTQTPQIHVCCFDSWRPDHRTVVCGSRPLIHTSSAFKLEKNPGDPRLLKTSLRNACKLEFDSPESCKLQGCLFRV